MSLTITAAPRSANACADARPIPLPAAVTNATLLKNSSVISTTFLYMLARVTTLLVGAPVIASQSRLEPWHRPYTVWR
jgi:hypothetical protein